MPVDADAVETVLIGVDEEDVGGGHGGSGCRLWVVGCGLWVVGCRLSVVGCGLSVIAPRRSVPVDERRGEQNPEGRSVAEESVEDPPPALLPQATGD